MKRSDPMYSYLHTKQRMEERYNYKNLTEFEYEMICKYCTEGIKINIESTKKGNQETYRMTFNGIEIIAVYQTWKEQVSTVLPYWKKGN